MNKIISDYLNEKEKFDLAVGALAEQTIAIIRVIASTLEVEDYWWDWNYYDTDHKSKSPEIDNDSVNVYVSKILDDGFWFYNESIPLEFYDKTEEEIVGIVELNLEAKRRAEDLKKSKAKEAKEKLKAKKAAVLNKLSKEDRRILNL